MPPRDAGGSPWVGELARDLAYSWRHLRRSPLFATTAVLTLAIGIGLNTIVFTIADAVLYQAFPLVARNDRLFLASAGGCLLPARRAMAIDPGETLRAE